MGKAFALVALVALVGAFAVAEDLDPGLALCIEKIGAAWSSPLERGLEVWKEITAEDCFIMIGHNALDESKTTTFSRAEFLRLFATMQTNNPSVSHVHQTERIEVFGDVAYEIARLEDRKKKGNAQTSRVLNVYRRFADGWKVILSTSADRVEGLF